MQQNTSLEEAKSHFDHWRATRTKRGKIPAYLWDKVKPLLLIVHVPQLSYLYMMPLGSGYLRNDLAKEGWLGGHPVQDPLCHFDQVNYKFCWHKVIP